MSARHFLACLLAVIGMAACTDDELPSPEAVITVGDLEISIDEMPVSGQILGRINARSDEPLTYTIVSQTPEGAISVNGQTGDIIASDINRFDFNTLSEIVAIVEVANQFESKEITVRIRMIDGTPQPSFTIWSGPSITFSKQAGSDPNQEANQDRITESVWITRGNNGGEIYNARSESRSTQNQSPAGTEWAVGTTANIANLTFSPFRSAIRPRNVVGRNLVLHIIDEDIYIDVRFTSWSQGGSGGNSGGFAYERSTP